MWLSISHTCPLLTAIISSGTQMWFPDRQGSFLISPSGSSGSWTYQSSHSVSTKVPQITPLNTCPKFISSSICTATISVWIYPPCQLWLHHGFQLVMCLWFFSLHQPFRYTTVEPPQWLYKINNTVYSHPSTVHTTQGPSTLPISLPQLPPYFPQEDSSAHSLSNAP